MTCAGPCTYDKMTSTETKQYYKLTALPLPFLGVRVDDAGIVRVHCLVRRHFVFCKDFVFHSLWERITRQLANCAPYWSTRLATASSTWHSWTGFTFGGKLRMKVLRCYVKNHQIFGWIFLLEFSVHPTIHMALDRSKLPVFHVNIPCSLYFVDLFTTNL